MRACALFLTLVVIACAPAAEYGTFERLFAQNSPWNIRPVDAVLGSVGVPADAYYPSIGEGAYSTGVFLAAAGDGPVTVYPRVGTPGIWDPDSSAYLSSITIPRWPAAAVGATGSDGHCDIVDPLTSTIHSFWILKQDAGGVWRAQQWAWAPLDGRGWGEPAHYFQGARAAGVPTCGGIIRKHEYRDGDTMYRHALAMSLTYSGLGSDPAYVFPATSADSGAATTNHGGVPEGALLMLPPDFNAEALSNGDLKKVARTLMTYGARVVDRNDGTPYAIYVENGTGWVGMGGGWNQAYANDLQAMRAALRMVSASGGWVDNAGNAVVAHPDGDGLPLLSLRSSWTVQSGSTPGRFDSLGQCVRWAATGATPTVQINWNGIGYNRVSWGRITGGETYRLTVRARNGAKLRLDIRHATTSALQYSTGDLADGQSVTFTCPAAPYLVPVATSGVNTSSSEVSCTLTTGAPITVPPTITDQPEDRQVPAGQMAAFSVTASGSPAPTYQWQRNGVDIPGATGAFYTTPATIAADNGAAFRVRVANSAGSVISRAATLAIGGGWQANYYDALGFAGTRIERTDAAIDFAWGGAAPAPGIAAGSYSVRWRGLVEFPGTGTWTFTATADDGVRVWVGGKRIINRWADQGVGSISGQTTAMAGQLAEVVVEYYDAAGGSAIRLEWEGPGQGRQVVPISSVAPGVGDDLPGGWARSDVGSVATAGSASEAGGAWTVTGSGSGAWGTVDGVTIVGRPVVGDASITARVTAIGGGDAWAAAGVMVRESTAAGSRHAFACATGGNGLAFRRRPATDSVTNHTAGPAAAAPYWVRVERSGNLLIGSCSADGVAWTEIRRETVAMGSTVLIGLAVASRSGASACTATFTHVTIIAAAAAAN